MLARCSQSSFHSSRSILFSVHTSTSTAPSALLLIKARTLTTKHTRAKTATTTMASDSSRDVPFPGHIDEALGERLQPHEAEFTTKIADTIGGSIHRQYDSQPGCARRDVHSKATGILKAHFKVHEDLPPHLAKGVFIPGKTYEAIIRLSNASGNPRQEDGHEDGRGCSIKLLNVPGPKLLETDKDATTQDFVMINHPFFFANNAQSYLDVVRKSVGSTLQKMTIPFSLGLKGTLIAGRLSTGKIANPLQVQYFSAVPYQLGVGEGRQAVKYSIKPVSTQQDPMPHDPSHDFLHEAIKSTVAQGDVQFKFMVQPKVNDHMDVEDSMTEWSQEESPFQEVATITIPRQDADSEELLKLGERLSFNPWHSIAEHRPLGSLNRTRKVVYERISRVRDQINSVPREEPTHA